MTTPYIKFWNRQFDKAHLPTRVIWRRLYKYARKGGQGKLETRTAMYTLILRGSVERAVGFEHKVIDPPDKYEEITGDGNLFEIFEDKVIDLEVNPPDSIETLYEEITWDGNVYELIDYDEVRGLASVGKFIRTTDWTE